MRLEQNYRSTAEILAMANRLIAFNKKRHPKELRAARRGGDKPRVEQYKDEVAEAESVAGDIGRWLQRGGWEPRDFAILCRTNEQPRLFEAALRRAKLPYVLIGTASFFDRKEVRDILAYLKVMASPGDEISLLRVINTPPRGIGPKVVEGLLAEAVKSGQTVWDILQRRDRQGQLTEKAGRAVDEFVAFIDQSRPRFRKGSLAEEARRLLGAIDYAGELAARLFGSQRTRGSLGCRRGTRECPGYVRGRFAKAFAEGIPRRGHPGGPRGRR